MKPSTYRRYGMGQKDWFDKLEAVLTLVVPYVVVFIAGCFMGQFWAFVQNFKRGF
jgi:hypothetical protein